MNAEQIIQAWKDPEYRSSLSVQERGMMPDNPAGPIELTIEDLGTVAGGCSFGGTCSVFTFGCCEKPR